ncbi:MAG: hypothetical protein ACI8Z1_001706 [Candidatus Azotimanducaceae bacterium]|jgi:hypothetical protein
MDAADLNNDHRATTDNELPSALMVRVVPIPCGRPLPIALLTRHVLNNHEIRKIEISASSDNVVVAAPPNGFVGDWY